MEITEEETKAMVRDILLNSLVWFEFPRFHTDDYILDEENSGEFQSELSNEEKNIIASYMIVEWLGQQLASVEVTRMKYSGTDFKFTSQANHMSKLQSLKKQYITEGFHKQRLYKRRIKDKETGVYKSTMSRLAGIR